MSIFSGIKELFEPQSEDDRAAENPNFIVRPNRIKNILERFVESQVQVTIKTDDDEEHSSRILAVKRNGIVLDQLLSRTAHRNIINDLTLQIEAKYHSIPFNFKSRVVDNKVNKNSGYLISFPEKIYHPQKRDFFRLPLKETEQHKFIGSAQYSENTVTGYIYDISFGGLSIAVNSKVYVKKGDIIAPASLYLGKTSERVDCDLTVCAVKKSTMEGFNRIGCQYLNLSSDNKKRIHQFINEEDRKRAKISNENSRKKV